MDTNHSWQWTSGTSIASLHMSSDDDDGRRSGVCVRSTCIDEMFIFTSSKCKYVVCGFVRIVRARKKRRLARERNWINRHWTRRDDDNDDGVCILNESVNMCERGEISLSRSLLSRTKAAVRINEEKISRSCHCLRCQSVNDLAGGDDQFLCICRKKDSHPSGRQ